jgi:ketosteroid isomerase-like protein
MKANILLIVIALIASISQVSADTPQDHSEMKVETFNDSTRIAELDEYWAELSRTVQEGDFKGYAATYHDDAVIIFATGENKSSIPVEKALAGWRQGFEDTESGKVSSDVEFRFSQRIGDATTAHETGIFHYTSSDQNGKVIADHLVHFEMLLIKRGDTWLGVMEYQKSIASEKEWNALK